MSKSCRSLSEYIYEQKNSVTSRHQIPPTTPSRTIIETPSQFFRTIFPNPPRDHHLVISYLPQGRNKEKLLNFWLRAGEISEVDPFIEEMVCDKHDVYFGICLRRPDYPINPETGAPPLSKRGQNKDVSVMPGLWVDIDHSGGAHATEGLPSRTELLAFIETLPFEPSLVIDSGGGIHLYVLFSRLWRFSDEQDRWQGHLLLVRFQRTIQTLMASRGWHCDSTFDLSRVFRPAGTMNFKRDAIPVTCLKYSGRRYRPERLERASWMLPLSERPRREHVPFTGGVREGKPGEAFDAHCTPALMVKILEGHGWSVSHTDGGVTYLTRPGKDAGISGTLGHIGPNVFYCFSSNAQPLEGLEAYGPFRLYTVLQHQGDFTAAAQALSKKGWGAPRGENYDAIERIPRKGGAR